jgi:hypothetical protein
MKYFAALKKDLHLTNSTSPSKSLATTGPFVTSAVLPFLEFNLIKVMFCVALTDQILSSAHMHLKFVHAGWAQWLIPIILVTWEAELGIIAV